MKGFAVLLIAAFLVAAKGESATTKSYQQDAKVTQQAKKGVDLLTSSAHDQKVQIVQAQELQANMLANPRVLDEPSQHIQLQSAQFFDQDLVSPLNNLNQGAEQFYSMNQGPRQLRDGRWNAQQLHHNRVNEEHEIQAYEQLHRGQQMHSLTLEEQFRNRNQGFQGWNQEQMMHSRQMNQGQMHSRQMNQEQMHSRQMNQEQMHSRQMNQEQMHSRPMNQEQMHSRQMNQEQMHSRQMNQGQQGRNYAEAQQLDDQKPSQHMLSEDQVGRYHAQNQAGQTFTQDQAVMSHTGQAQFVSSRPDFQQGQLVSNTFGSIDRDVVGRRSNAPRLLVEQGGSFRQQPGLKTSAFEQRVQSFELPGMRRLHSPFLVSGLKNNLPSLPALVYRAGSVQSSPLVYSAQPWMKSAGYVRQHWQTPHARYVYSYVL